MGQEDHVPACLRERGELLVHGIAMRPSSPTGYGHLGEQHVLLLPGNPLSSLCAYEFFGGPLLRVLGGGSWDWPHRQVQLPLSEALASATGRVDYARVRVEDNRVVPLQVRGASILSSATRADGAVIIPRDAEGIATGETVTVHLYD